MRTIDRSVDSDSDDLYENSREKNVRKESEYPGTRALQTMSSSVEQSQQVHRLSLTMRGDVREGVHQYKRGTHHFRNRLLSGN
jgi:hypothetical protein